MSQAAKVRAVIVDDEQLGREGIRLRLHAEPDVQVVAECATGADAIAAIRRHKPDLVFLDVQMPDVDGFEVISQVGIERVPATIFVTAHDEHALRAFRVHAVDYLLKPVDDEQFITAVARARQLIGSRGFSHATEQLRSLLAAVGRTTDGARRAPVPIERLTVRSEGRITFIHTAEVDWIEAHGDYVKVHAKGRVELVRQSMAELARTLDPLGFVRIHRSVIVNVDRVKELQPYFHGEFEVLLTTGKRLKVSRTYRAALAGALGAQL